MPKQINLYLSILSYGEEMLQKQAPVKPDELYNHLMEQGYEFNTAFSRSVLNTYFGSIFFGASNLIDSATGELNKSVHEAEAFITPESYQNFLDYKELEEARKSSRQARTYAVFAIVLTVITLLVSIVFSYLQLRQTQSINPEQFKTIQDIQSSLDRSRP